MLRLKSLAGGSGFSPHLIRFHPQLLMHNGGDTPTSAALHERIHLYENRPLNGCTSTFLEPAAAVGHAGPHPACHPHSTFPMSATTCAFTPIMAV